MVRRKSFVLVFIPLLLAATACSPDQPVGPPVWVDPSPSVSASAGLGSVPASPSSAVPLSVEFVGTGTDMKEPISVRATGFTPNGTFKITVRYPQELPEHLQHLEGAPYTYLNGTNPIGSDGQLKMVTTIVVDGVQKEAVTPWEWDYLKTADGKPDPEGDYLAVFTDLATGRTFTTEMRIQY